MLPPGFFLLPGVYGRNKPAQAVLLFFYGLFNVIPFLETRQLFLPQGVQQAAAYVNTNTALAYPLQA